MLSWANFNVVIPPAFAADPPAGRNIPQAGENFQNSYNFLSTEEVFVLNVLSHQRGINTGFRERAEPAQTGPFRKGKAGALLFLWAFFVAFFVGTQSRRHAKR